MYHKEDKVRYKTIDFVCKNGKRYCTTIEKVGVIEEAFQTLNNTPCYWIKNEKYLIIEPQIYGIVE